MQKILAVAPVIDVSEFSEGLRRFHRAQNFNLTDEQLLEWCRHLPFCTVEAETVIARDIDVNVVLEGTELAMYEILKVKGSALPTLVFEDLCKKRGVSRVAFYSSLSYSPIIKKFGPGLYGLRGSKISTEQIIESGKTAKGNIWLKFQLTREIIGSGRVCLPNSISNLTGEYQIRGGEGHFTISDEGFIKGLTGTLQSHSALAEQYAGLLFDVRRLEALVLITDLPAEPADFEMFESFINEAETEGAGFFQHDE